MKKKKKLIKKISAIITILVVVLAVLVVAQLDSLDYIKNPFQEPTHILIKDECSLIFNNLIHKFKTADECKVLCTNECTVRELEFHDATFTEKIDACHECSCYCK